MVAYGVLKRSCLALYLGATLLADPGPRIPLPKLSMNQAIKAAQKQLVTDMPVRPGSLRPDQMLLVEVRYVSENYLTQEYPKAFPRSAPVIENPRWFWIVGYVQPVSNDVTYTYCVNQIGQVRLLLRTS